MSPLPPRALLAPALLFLSLTSCTPPRPAADAAEPAAVADATRPAIPSAPTDPDDCPSCAEWNAPQAPFKVFGDTYYVGPHGLSALLITSPEGHVLIDGGLPESAPVIAANIEALGFRVEDVRLILNSHAHSDHAGGIAWLQRASGAAVAASPWSAGAIADGDVGPDDPQYEIHLAYPPVPSPRVIADGEVLRVGPLALTAHFTPGHTPGGTSWSWRSCEGARCLDLVYADSMTPVSADGYRFTGNEAKLAEFARSYEVLEHVACDVLITPHPDASGLWARLASREEGAADALVDPAACTRYAATARQRLATRLEEER